jgi:hypothetical protein
MTWIGASLRGFAVVLYFVITTVWLPDFVARLGFVEGSDLVTDLAVSAVWGVALFGGMWMLRIGQRMGFI